MKSQPFNSEQDLVQAILACIRRARRHEYRVELEVDAGVGIADLVLTKRAAHSTESLRALGSISPRLAILLSNEIGNSIKSTQALSASSGTSSSATGRIIKQLSSKGLVRRTPDSLHLVTVKTPPFERLIAVEAKLSDWQRVLVQAYRNLQFADESWVVLDHRYLRPAITQIERFKAAGVGLASIDYRGGLFVHHAAQASGPMSMGKRWQAQAVLAARILERRRR